MCLAAQLLDHFLDPVSHLPQLPIDVGCQLIPADEGRRRGAKDERKNINVNTRNGGRMLNMRKLHAHTHAHTQWHIHILTLQLRGGGGLFLKLGIQQFLQIRQLLVE